MARDDQVEMIKKILVMSEDELFDENRLDLELRISRELKKMKEKNPKLTKKDARKILEKKYGEDAPIAFPLKLHFSRYDYDEYRESTKRKIKNDKYIRYKKKKNNHARNKKSENKSDAIRLQNNLKHYEEVMSLNNHIEVHSWALKNGYDPKIIIDLWYLRKDGFVIENRELTGSEKDKVETYFTKFFLSPDVIAIMLQISVDKIREYLFKEKGYTANQFSGKRFGLINRLKTLYFKKKVRNYWKLGKELGLPSNIIQFYIDEYIDEMEG